LEFFGAHVDKDLSVQEGDAPALGELCRMGPGPEAVQRVGPGGYDDLPVEQGDGEGGRGGVARRGGPRPAGGEAGRWACRVGGREARSGEVSGWGGGETRGTRSARGQCSRRGRPPSRGPLFAGGRLRSAAGTV